MWDVLEIICKDGSTEQTYDYNIFYETEKIINFMNSF
jgi:hypothetical protein